MSTTGGPAAGWYPDSSNPGMERWWDGQAWSQQTRPAGAPEPAPAPAPGPSGPPPIPQPGPGAPGTPPPVSPFAATQQGPAGGQPGPLPGPGSPGAFPPPQQQRSKLPLILGLVVGCVLLLGGCLTLVVVAGSGDDDSVQATDTSTTADPDDATSDATAAEATATDQAIGDSDEVGDVLGCTRVDDTTIVIEAVNSSSNTSSYFLTVAFLDDSGQRLGDETAFINYLRPGERTIESQFTFEEAGTACEVIEVDRQLAESADDELADIGACEILDEPDFIGDFQATTTATNSSSSAANYVIEVALIDPDGIRRGTGAAFVDAVRPGETAPTDIFTTSDFAPGYTCEVVGVSRSAI